MNYSEYFQYLEQAIAEAVRDCFPFEWEENHITFSITKALFKKNQIVSLEGLDRPFKILWDVRKLRKPAETDFGDVAVIVRLTTWAGEILEGVGLLEAKRRDARKNTFSAAKLRQLRQISSKAPSARLMLYDYDNVSSCMDNSPIQFDDHFYRRRYGSVQPYTHCVCLPVGIAIQQGKFTTDLHKFGVPLSYQLVGRYFRGFDLELDPNTVAAVKGNALKNGGARTLLLVGVSTSTAEPTLPDINGNLYGPPEDI
jgi:hypothetical protein